MKGLAKLLGLVVLVWSLPTMALAQSKIDDCEKIQAADAYNQCLAKFGPPAKTGNLEPSRPGDVKSSSAEAAAGGGKASLKGGVTQGRRARRGRGTVARRGKGGRPHIARARGGRKRMTISIHR